MQIRKIWKIKDESINNDILSLCENNKILAVLLQNRGINTKEKITAFLNPLKSPLTNPNVFTDMEKAALRIQQAVENSENITVYGDFDSDGITSCALLYLTLKKIGAKADYYLPDRTAESHGLNTKALVNIISKKKSKLIITVDCGISNIQEVNFAKGFKTDVIITDHHEAPSELPSAAAIINPKAQNALIPDLTVEQIESLNNLSGAGVAFKLACKLLDLYNMQDFVHEILPLCAVGTVGDVVNITGENRIIVEMGLELLRSGKSPNIQAILKSAGILDPQNLTSENIAFALVPRLNASGRLDNASIAFNLLISEDENLINESVKKLNDLNSLRQKLCDETFEQAKDLYENNISAHKKSIVLYSPDWHIGIIGIVASKLVEMYNKPTFLMTKDPNYPEIIRCSCRSIEGIDIHNILSQHKDLFEGFGGHKMAAGFSFNENKINFDNFKNLLNTTIDENTHDIDFKSVKINADMLLEPNDITFSLIDTINKMQPFGAGNPPPLFVMNDTVLKDFKLMGQNNNHLKLFVSKNNSQIFECVKWNTPNFNPPLNSKLDILFAPAINSFNGANNIQLMLSDIHSEALAQNQNFSEIKILDHRKKTNILVQVLDYINTTKKSTAIFLENAILKKELNLPKDIINKTFSSSDIPSECEQIMFFDCPVNEDDFYRIIKDSDAKIIHLMNFNIPVINTDNLLTKLSGMLKYAISNLNGKINLKRASSALNVDVETLECALDLFENCEMTTLNKNNSEEYTITYFNSAKLSGIKNDEMYYSLDEHIKNINEFRQFYLNSSTENIKEAITSGRE